MTPVQLWVNGLMQKQGSNHRVAQELRQRVSNFLHHRVFCRGFQCVGRTLRTDLRCWIPF